MRKKKTKEEEYQEGLMKQAKGTIGLGVATGIGSYMFGRVGAAHPIVRPTSDAVQAGLNLTNVGNVAGIGLGLAKGMGKLSQSQERKRTRRVSTVKKKTKNYAEDRVRRILG